MSVEKFRGGVRANTTGRRIISITAAAACWDDREGIVRCTVTNGIWLCNNKFVSLFLTCLQLSLNARGHVDPPIVPLSHNVLTGRGEEAILIGQPACMWTRPLRTGSSGEKKPGNPHTMEEEGLASCRLPSFTAGSSFPARANKHQSHNV